MSGEWRVDPTGRFEYRWWDGERYTEYVARHGEQLEDPAGIPDPAALTRTIEVGFGSTERQNRWTVGFRIVLALPVLIVVNWLSFGVTISLIVVWIVVLAKGRMPGMLAQALGAVIRYEARTYGYTMLLTSEYPVGLYGDKDPYGEIRRSGLEVPGTAASGAPPRTARLHLGIGAKRLVTLFLVMGIAYNVANNVLTWRTDEQDLSVATAAVVGEPPPSGE